MESKKIREPMQSRSIDKKNRIIEAAYEVFSEAGYYNANTTDIAKRAGVSTGIVYGYFEDKRDILLYVIDIYMKKVATPCMEYFEKLAAPLDIEKTICDIIDITTTIHKQNANLHNILHSLTVSDEKVRDKFLFLEDHITMNASAALKKLGVDTPFITEKVHLSMNLIQSFSHEFTYDRHDYINYDELKKLTVSSIKNMFI